MSQNWIAVDLDERVCLHGGGKLVDWFWSSPSSVVDALRIPDTSQIIDELLTTHPTTATQGAPLFRLPPELVDHIFAHVISSAGAFDARLLLLALTCKYLLACARRHIVRLNARHHAPLAGHRLICIGDRARTLTDYPAGLLTSAEAEMLLASKAASPNVHHTNHGTPATGAGAYEPEDGLRASLYAHASARWWRYSFRRPSLLSCVGLGGASKRGKGASAEGCAGALMDLMHRPSPIARMSTKDFARFQALTAPSCPSLGSDEAELLCNLSKREYVRADAGLGDVYLGPPKQGELDRVGYFAGSGEGRTTALWHVLLACICWSPPGSTAKVLSDGESRRGRWAGDRFVVMTMGGMLQSDPDKEVVWVDVTEDVVAFLKNMRDEGVVYFDD
ncbi:hypothetical protein C8Q80DRAFT_1270882 [Daedaleopsis nitida]|nr:hypothetical protein C8Q80DRAFT_1270882 [Daedaleopsis nitida]